MKKKILNNKYIIIIFTVLFNLILFITKIILNSKGLEFMSWVYYLSAIITLIVIIYLSIKKISSSENNKIKKILSYIYIPIIETILFFIVIFILFATMNIGVDKIITIENKKIVKSNGLVEIHPSPTYYEYYNFIVRKTKTEQLSKEMYDYLLYN